MVTLLPSAALAWALAVLTHWWPLLPGAWRRRLSILASAAGLVFLVAAIASEGLRESATTAAVVVGPASVTARASASASLYYYVLTAVCLSLGFAGLAFGERLARWLSRRWLLSATAVAYLVTGLRFLLEKSAAPVLLIQGVSVTWMAPVAGIFLADCLRREGKGRADLLRSLVAYAFLVRGFVALLSVTVTRLHLGSHFDASPLVEVPVALTGHAFRFAPGSWAQVFWLVLVPQLVVWTSFTVAVGLLGGLVAWRWPLRRATARPATTLAEAEREG